MKKIIGFCNLHNSPQLGQLTASRPMASTSFLGRYAFIDFCLFNFSVIYFKLWFLCFI